MTTSISYWNYPAAIYAGENALSVLPQVCKQYGLQNILLVSDVGLHGLGLVARIAEPLRLLARVLALQGDTVDDVIDWVLALRSTLGIPHTLAEIGIHGEDSVLIGERAVADISSSDTNPIPFTAAQYGATYRRAVSGETRAALGHASTGRDPG